MKYNSMGEEAGIGGKNAGSNCSAAFLFLKMFLSVSSISPTQQVIIGPSEVRATSGANLGRPLF